MDKYKICPSCNKKNTTGLFECAFCEADLTNVKVVDELTENQGESLPCIELEQAEQVRVCDCGEINPSAARKCSACNEDISDITPTPANKSQAETILFTFCSLDGEYAFSIKKPVTLIGREQEMSDYLKRKNFVSRTHIKLSIVNKELYIENLSQTNFTYINNQIIESNIPVLLHEGDEIGLGGIVKNNTRQNDAAYFILRTNSCI